MNDLLDILPSFRLNTPMHHHTATIHLINVDRQVVVVVVGMVMKRAVVGAM